MIAVDTNVLVRVVVDDPDEPQQMARARRQVTRAGQVFVPQIVQAELVWVLDTAYELDRSAIVPVLQHMLDNAAFVLQGEPAFRAALSAYQTGPADFADYLILAESRAAGCSLVTFDRRLLKADGTRAVGGRDGGGR